MTGKEGTSLIEWGGLLWKFAEKPLGLISESLLDRFRRWRAQRTIRAASGRKISIILAKITGDTSADSYRKTLHETIRGEFADAVEIVLWPATLPNLDGHEYDAE